MQKRQTGSIANGEAWRSELVKVEKQIQGIIEAIKEGMFQPSMKAAMDGLESRKAELVTLLCESPLDVPDILPSTSKIYAKKVGRLTEALNKPEDRGEGNRSPTQPDRTDSSGTWSQSRCNERNPLWRIGHDLGVDDPPRPMKSLQKRKLPQRLLRECRERWLRGDATTDTDIQFRLQSNQRVFVPFRRAA
ncbi:hypothetical protein [Bradyrhizobium sp. NAS80.1]|uniref:hypothetical protein n=1 Tax=Bradyrhizobium sp. NAS80.1 TaxID=1680159 RepID=UPI001FD895CA|nr:hypothetical protein [Bradyrhizobium sp. NAS80.1]